MLKRIKQWLRNLLSSDILYACLLQVPSAVSKCRRPDPARLGFVARAGRLSVEQQGRGDGGRGRGRHGDVGAIQNRSPRRPAGHAKWRRQRARGHIIGRR